MTIPHEGRQPGPATGVSLLIPSTLATMAVVLLAPILPQLQQEFGAVPGAAYLVPMILTIPALCIALLSPVAGLLGDLLGRRRLLLGSLAVYGLVGVAPVFLSDIRWILATRVGVGIAEALIMTLSTTMIGDYFEGTRRDRWLAGQTAVASLSALLFFNLGGLLGTAGWQAPFWVYLSAWPMMAAVLLFTWPARSDRTGTPDAAEPRPGFPYARLGGIVAVTIFAAVLFYTVQIQAAPALTQLGLRNPAEIGFLTSVASLGVPLGTLAYSRVSRLPVAWLLGAEFAVLGIGFLIMSQASASTPFLLGCALNQLGAGMILPTLLVWAMAQLPYNVRGRGTGIWQSAFALGQFLSPIAVTTIGFGAGGLMPALSWLSYAALAAAVAAALSALRGRGSIARKSAVAS